MENRAGGSCLLHPMHVAQRVIPHRMHLFGTVELLVQNPTDRPVMGAQIHWLTEWSDWRFVKQWQRTSPPHDTSTMRDSLEYAALAGKRWRFLREQKLTVASWHDLRRHLQRDAAAEIGLALAITGTESRGPAVLGVAFARRTRANNLILEFLASSPEAMSRPERHRGRSHAQPRRHRSLAYQRRTLGRVYRSLPGILCETDAAKHDPPCGSSY